MPNDVVPKADHPNWLEQLNLPKLIVGPAGEALSRLIAGATDIPLAWLERRASEIRTKTAATNAVTHAVAKEVAASSRKDAALIERATNSLLIKEFRRQANKEAVAQRTIEHLRDEPTVDEHPTKPDEDWLNVFEQYAEQASSEKLQDLWARVLAGQIRRPKSFSLRTIRFIAELDQDIASLFDRHAESIFDGRFIPKPLKAKSIAEFVAMEDYGLISGASGMLSANFVLKSYGALLRVADRHIRIVGTEGVTISIPCMPVSKTGQEIAAILTRSFNRTRVDTLVECVPKGDVSSIELGFVETVGEENRFLTQEVIWKKAP